jgi:hypothetical protein
VTPVAVRFALAAALALIPGGGERAMTNWNGLLVETPETGHRDPDFFNRDNTIYVPGREFVYSYTIRKGGHEVYCRTDAAGDPATRNWSFVERAAVDPLTIRYVGFRVLPGYGGMDDLFPDYAQTVIEQRYWSPDRTLLFDGTTGLVENAVNVWIHPFRGKYFSVTEFSPFPFAKFPLTKGRTWEWRLDDIDTRWSDPRIVTYEGKVAAQYSYEVVGTETLATPMGKLECTIIDGTARNRLGSARLRSHFHPRYGFVRLDYRNLDDSRILLELTRVTEAKPAVR